MFVTCCYLLLSSVWRFIHIQEGGKKEKEELIDDLGIPTSMSSIQFCRFLVPFDFGPCISIRAYRN